jgi:hypothetical protein
MDTQLILDDHSEQRRQFATREEVGNTDAEALAELWCETEMA